MAGQSIGLDALLEFPLMQAVFGRRSRRFGLGMEIPSGPLAFRSGAEALPLSEVERSVLVAAGTGVTGWSFGVPFGSTWSAGTGGGGRDDRAMRVTERYGVAGRPGPHDAAAGGATSAPMA